MVRPVFSIIFPVSCYCDQSSRVVEPASFTCCQVYFDNSAKLTCDSCSCTNKKSGRCKGGRVVANVGPFFFLRLLLSTICNKTLNYGTVCVNIPETEAKTTMAMMPRTMETILSIRARRPSRLAPSMSPDCRLFLDCKKYRETVLAKVEAPILIDILMDNYGTTKSLHFNPCPRIKLVEFPWCYYFLSSPLSFCHW